MHITIIAEAGVNHNGDIELAKKLIEAAARAGADYVKFQSFKTEKLVSKKAQQAEYQTQNIGKAESQYEMLKKLELSEEDHHILFMHCKSNNIGFLSTAFDIESGDFLEKLGMDVWKIPSGEITNLPYLQYMSVRKEPLIVSTGMSDMQDIQAALKVLIAGGKKLEDITVLHCTTEYPAPFNEVNLSAMYSIADTFKVKVGYSDHTQGIDIPIAAAALGATIIEKHFTLDKSLPGPDHKASLEPEELKAMVSGIRNVELAIGNGLKVPSSTEIKNINAARKSIHINKDLKSTHKISEEDLMMQRPGDGISPMEMPKVIGKEIITDLKEGAQLKWEDIK